MRRRERASFMFKLMMGLALAIFVGVWLGRQYAGSEVITLRKRTAEQEQIVIQLQEQITQARSRAQVAQTRLNTMQEEVSKTLPEEGPLRELIAELRKRLDEGVSPERLSFIIKSGRPPSNCVEPQTKRFIVTTPELDKTDSSISVDNDDIKVFGKGVSARSDKGAAEAWFDPAKPVTVFFETKSGEKSQEISTLPFSTTIVEGAREYRFTIEEGARSFIKVVYDSCDYP